MTHDQALAALHQGARRMLRRQMLVAVLAAVGFGAAGIPSDLDQGHDLATAAWWAVLASLMWGLPMWLFFRYVFMQEHRRVLNVDELLPAHVVALRNRRHLTVRIDEGTDLVLPTTTRADRIEVGQRVWLTQPAEPDATVTAVTEPTDEAGRALLLWPRGIAAAPSRWI